MERGFTSQNAVFRGGRSDVGSLPGVGRRVEAAVTPPLARCVVPVLSHWSKPLEPEGGQGFAPIFAEHLGCDQVAGVHAQRRTAV